MNYGRHQRFGQAGKGCATKIHYITIATSDKSGQPWNSPVSSTFDKEYNFFWASWTENQHSKNIKENPKVFVVVYDSTAPEGTGFGVYMKGKARQLDKKEKEEIKKAINSKDAKKVQEFLGDYPRRIFKFVPEKVWVNGDGDINGSFVDKRIDITDDILKH